MGIRLWVKEQVAKLRRKHDDEHDDAKHQQLQAIDGSNGTRGTRGCSVLFARARKHHDERHGRKKARSRSHPAPMNARRSEESTVDFSKPCAVCQTLFDVHTSKFLDYCSTDCKMKASAERGSAPEALTPAREWI